METKAKRVFEEVVATEETYQKNLSICVGVWIKPLLLRAHSEGCSISIEDAKIAASNLEEILNRQAPLLTALKERLANYNPNTTTIGDLFQEADWLEPYVEYIQNWHAQTKKVQEIKSRKDFPSAADNAAANPHMGLESYIIMPVSRVPRYLLLLVELQRCTPEDHPDHPLLTSALEVMRKKANMMNDALRRNEEGL